MPRWTRSFFFLGTLLVLLVETLVAGGVIAAALQLSRLELAKSEIESAESIFEDMRAIEQVSDDITLKDVVRLRASRTGTDDIFLLVDAQGSRLAGNLSTWPSDGAQERLPDRLSVQPIGQERVRSYAVFETTLENGNRLLVGHTLEGGEKAIAALRRALLTAALLGLPLAIAAAWLVVRIVDARLRSVEDALLAFDQQDMSARISLNGSGDTFDRLGGIANSMLDRVEVLVGELRLVTDSLAHDLRSPLTRLKNRLVGVQESTEVEEHCSANEAVQVELDHVLSILTQMLQIGRAEAGVGREAFVDLDLGQLVSDFAEIYGPVAEEAGRSLIASVSDQTTIMGQPDLLARAMANLVENALTYGKGAIEISVGESEDGIEIAVSDEGDGIPVERQGEALKRFGRLDSARSKGGSGLGLSLARAVAHLHGGELHFANGEGRFAVVIKLRNSVD